MAFAMRVRSLLGVAGALAAGAFATFFLDPEQGRRRRAIARDKLVSGLKHASGSSQALAQSVRNRSTGLVAGARQRLSPAPVSDDVLAERVRARMGHNVSHASIDVRVEQGEVILRGPVLDSELESLLRAVRAVPGVRGVVNQLEPHPRAGNIPGLQS
jgi:osmotically-inducible protein OsmY